MYVGEQTAERVNIGYSSGHVIAIVPGSPDIAKTPIWFGAPELPERIDINTARKASALTVGIKPFSLDKVKAALTKGGERLTVADRDALRPHFSTLLQQYSPDERELIEMFNVPVTK